jgi:CheY-like chemotaxis protein
MKENAMARILVIDDSLDMQRLCKRTLEHYGHEVVTVHSIELAWRALVNHNFDLIISDIILQGPSGFDFLAELKASTLPHPPVIVLTGRKGATDVMTALKLGAVDYICKPFDRDVFKSKINSVLGLSNKLNFALSEVHREGFIKKPTTILSIAEDGLKILNGEAYELGAKIKLDSPLFDEIGISPFHLRVVECNETKNKDFEITLGFVGLDDIAMRKIRQWIIQKNTSQAHALGS